MFMLEDVKYEKIKENQYWQTYSISSIKSCPSQMTIHYYIRMSTERGNVNAIFKNNLFSICLRYKANQNKSLIEKGMSEMNHFLSSTYCDGQLTNDTEEQSKNLSFFLLFLFFFFSQTLNKLSTNCPAYRLDIK